MKLTAFTEFLFDTLHEPVAVSRQVLVDREFHNDVYIYLHESIL